MTLSPNSTSQTPCHKIDATAGKPSRAGCSMLCSHEIAACCLNTFPFHATLSQNLFKPPGIWVCWQLAPQNVDSMPHWRLSLPYLPCFTNSQLAAIFRQYCATLLPQVPGFTARLKTNLSSPAETTRRLGHSKYTSQAGPRRPPVASFVALAGSLSTDLGLSPLYHCTATSKGCDRAVTLASTPA